MPLCGCSGSRPCTEPMHGLPSCRYEDAPLGMQAIKAAGFLKAVDVTKMPGYPKLV